jgi:ABC-type uncharacterized transport system permease subunit
MINSLTLSLSAVVAIIPAAILPFRRDPARDAVFWILLLVAVAGPAVWIVVSFDVGWRTGFADALWITIMASLLLFGVLSALLRDVWRLAPLLLPYMVLIGLLATVWLHEPDVSVSAAGPSLWVRFHIVVSVMTYGMLTIGATAGLAVMLQERALKLKRPGKLTRTLPSVADGERIQVWLLSAGAAILGCGLLSGMAAQFIETGQLIEFSHKVALSVLTFVTIVVLLAVHIRTGIRGRRAARYILVAYLLITLAYPGVKFVTDVLLT